MRIEIDYVGQGKLELRWVIRNIAKIGEVVSFPFSQAIQNKSFYVPPFLYPNLYP